MECPFKKELEEGSMVCDSGYSKCNTPQCPTNIFNQCQEDANSNALKKSKTE